MAKKEEEIKRTKKEKSKKEITAAHEPQVETVPQEKEVTLIKRGTGRFTYRNRIIKPNEKFKAYLSEIPKAFRDVLERVYEDDSSVTNAPEKQTQKIVHRIVLIEDSEVNKEIQSQVEALEAYDFEDEESLTELRNGLKENGNETLAELDKEVLKDAILGTLKAKLEYNIVNAKGKVQNEKPLTLVEAEKIITVL